MRRIYYNSWLAKLLLAKDYDTAMLFGVICTKVSKDSPLSDITKCHESIHAEQYREVTWMAFCVALILQVMFGGGWWFVPVPVAYYLLYFLEAVISIAVHVARKGWSSALKTAYENSMFEQEAFDGELIPEYIESRRFCAFLRYFGKI